MLPLIKAERKEWESIGLCDLVIDFLQNSIQSYCMASTSQLPGEVLVIKTPEGDIDRP